MDLQIKPGDLFGTPPDNWWQRLICRIIGAHSFHWGCFISDDANSTWVITESIGKGVALTRFNYPRAYVYRIKDIGEVSWKRLINIVADYGDYPYDWEVAFRMAIWWLLRHYFNKVLPIQHDKEVNCVEWVALICNELGVKIVNDEDYPTPENLEYSSYLQFIGEVKQ